MEISKLVAFAEAVESAKYAARLYVDVRGLKIEMRKDGYTVVRLIPWDDVELSRDDGLNAFAYALRYAEQQLEFALEKRP